jgi:uncharacterized membrane protein YozB (DUF420 family)
VDAKVAYWTLAFANMTAIAALAVAGVRSARRGELARHARAMRAAALLVALFLLSYVAKLALLGREALDAWSPAALGVLRFHELCVLVMLLAGSLALGLGTRFRATRAVSGSAADPPAPPRRVRVHRLAGRAALAGALLGAASAALVLAGMYARGGWIELPALAAGEAPRPAE